MFSTFSATKALAHVLGLPGSDFHPCTGIIPKTFALGYKDLYTKKWRPIVPVQIINILWQIPLETSRRGVGVSLVSPCPPPPVFLQNDRSRPISLSSESTRDNLLWDDESVALVGIELSPASGGGINSLSSSYSCSSKRPRIGRLRGSQFIPPHMQQMKLCTSDIPTNAIAGQRINIAGANFMHSHILPFSLTECPKFLKLLNTAKTLGTGYLPPDRRKMSGPLLDMCSTTQIKKRW